MWLEFCLVLFPFSVILQALRPWTLPFSSLTPLCKALNSMFCWLPFPLWFVLFDLLAGPETLNSLPHRWAWWTWPPCPYSCPTKLTRWARMDSWSFGNYRLESCMDSSAKGSGYFLPQSDWEGLEEPHPPTTGTTSTVYKHTHFFLLKRKQVRNFTSIPQSCYWSCLWKVPLGHSLSSSYVSGTFHDSFLSILTRLLGRRYFPILLMRKLKIGKIKWPTIKDWRQASNPGLPGTIALSTLEGSLCRTKPCQAE